ncbi:MAG: hypothetical protein H6697_12565, partial [Myxococcales bacterium]|nr:hypothetical protein [Myxococcales bacterium]
MDLRELERWSRTDLDREGRRIGIYRPEALSRGELERRVREHHRTPAARAIGRARGVFGKVLGLARSLATVASLPPPTPTAPPRRPSPIPAPPVGVRKRTDSTLDANPVGHEPAVESVVEAAGLVDAETG